MIYLKDVSIIDWESKYPRLRDHPDVCLDCNYAIWKMADLVPWVSKNYVGIARTCNWCKKRQDFVFITDKTQATTISDFIDTRLFINL